MNFVDRIKHRRRTRRSSHKRLTRAQRGGTGGFGYSFGQAVSAHAPYAAEVMRFPSCESANRTGALTHVPNHGLPGMYGGRYTNLFEVVGPAGIAITNQQNIPCDVSHKNSFPSPMPAIKGGKRKMRGGVGGPDSAFYIAPRAGYTHLPSDMSGGESGILADGKTPFLLNVPYDNTPVANPACNKTGGKRKTRKGKKAKKSKKGKKTSCR